MCCLFYFILFFLVFNFYFLLHEHASTFSQTDRLTSCPQDFWLVNRDREPFCFLYDSAITQRLTQWNSSVTPRGFGDSEREDRIPLSVYSLALFSAQSASQFHCFWQAGTWCHTGIQALLSKHTNTYTRASRICLEECVQLLIRTWMQQNFTRNASIAALYCHLFIDLFIFPFPYPHLLCGTAHVKPSFYFIPNY